MRKTFDHKNPPSAIPVDALKFAADPMKFSETEAAATETEGAETGSAENDLPDGESATDGQTQTAPVSILARTKNVNDHWYWGRCVHDLDGMTSKPSVPIDYSHRDEVIGAADRFSVVETGLEASGNLVLNPADPKDRASEVLRNGKAGVPYEASIWFDEISIEKVGDGQSVDVNGETFEGPGVVFRKWKLKAVTISPHGQDSGTETKFSASDETATVTYVAAPPATEDTPADANKWAARFDAIDNKVQALADLVAAMQPTQETESGEAEPDASQWGARLDVIEAQLKQLDAATKFALQSSDDAADGSDGEPAGEPSPKKWSDLFVSKSKPKK